MQKGARTSQEVLYLPPKLNARIAALGGVVASADAAPTQQAYEHFEELSAQTKRDAPQADRRDADSSCGIRR